MSSEEHEYCRPAIQKMGTCIPQDSHIVLCRISPDWKAQRVGLRRRATASELCGHDHGTGQAILSQITLGPSPATCVHSSGYEARQKGHRIPHQGQQNRRNVR